MSRFLITGLPRSRTAWMSVTASTCIRNAMCWHEPVSWLQDWGKVESLWGANIEHTGIADAHLGFRLHGIMNRVSPNVLVIERAIAEVEKSLARFTGLPANNYVDLLRIRLDEWRGHRSFKYVDFADLNDRLGECLRHLAPGARIDEVRAAEMCRLNIQADQRILDVARDSAHLIEPELLAELRFK